MSASFLYHALGLIGFEYLKTIFQKGTIKIFIRKEPARLRCPDCDSYRIKLKGTVTRQFKSIPIGKKQIILNVTIQRIHCQQCGCLKQIKLGFADPKKTYSRAFARYALELLRFSTIKDVAQHLDVSWDTIKEIQKNYLLKRFNKPSLKNLKQIAIDEITIGRKHKYLTIVLDLKSGAVVFIGDGKGADSLKPFWKKLKRAKAVIEAVATDMSPAYIQAVRSNLPHAVMVFDHFHVIKLYNDKLSELRRRLYYEVTDYMKSQALKGLRWILLKNPENLDKEKNEKERLETALKVNKPLATAYYLKEELRQLWNQPDKDEAQKHLENWITKARASDVFILKKFANTRIRAVDYTFFLIS